MTYTYQLENHPIVGSYEVTRYDAEDDAVILKIRLVVVDGSILHIKEYTDLYVRNYSFHWQTADDIWLVRWDNVPHFPKLASFPHHKHDYQTGQEIVTDSFDISLVEVLDYIQDQLRKPLT